MKLSQEQIDSILEEAKPSIIAGLREEITQQVRYNLSNEAARLVSAEVQKFIAEEIVPEIRSLLVESKAGLIATAVPLGEAIVEDLVRGLAESAKKNLEQSWTRGEILKQLFK